MEGRRGDASGGSYSRDPRFLRIGMGLRRVTGGTNVELMLALTGLSPGLGQSVLWDNWTSGLQSRRRGGTAGWRRGAAI
eukprot:2541302-Pyramimonas_sp.AAC.1